MKPIKFLFYKLRESFPNSKIHFQSLLPLPCRSNRDWDTNTRILETCKIIINECAYHRFYYLDAFHRFAIPFNMRKNDDPRCRNERLFEKSGIHPNVLRGVGALASIYLKALHSSYFNPFCIQWNLTFYSREWVTAIIHIPHHFPQNNDRPNFI